MSNRFLSAMLVAFSVVAVFSCKKKTEDPPAQDYSPLTAGSSWTYRSTTTGQAPSTYTLTATNRDTVVNTSGTARTYRVLSNSNGGSSYRNKTGNDYYSFGNFAAVNLQLEQLYLKGTAAVNETWQSSVPVTVPQGGTLIATLLYNIKSKGNQRTVNGVNFSNVTNVGLVINVAGLPGSIATADFYYAAGVGLIENTVNVNAIPIAGVPASSTTEILTAYTIR